LNEKCKSEFFYISSPEQLTTELIDAIKPKIIFFPHWSSFINSNIHDKHECVIFHMTDLPYGRGGSPLQNLINNKIYDTQISALRCTKEVDAGPIYLKRPLSLFGTAEEIFIRSSEVIGEMIVEIIQKNLIPAEQEGIVTKFVRRIPEQGNLVDITTIEQAFDRIRMLDADGYPNAFIEFGSLKFEFSRASLKTDGIVADVKISIRSKQK
jgi:methionyl-tRNA formyltransferase